MKRDRFPTNMRHWRIAFIPKKQEGQIAPVAELRLIAVGPIVYRLWSRMQALSETLSSSLLPTQGGGVWGQGAETLVASFHLNFPPSDWPHDVMLDFAKAFDSTDIISLIENQWCQHFRWLSVGSAIHKLPQADMLMYVDDRALVARSRPALLQAVEVWNIFETLTRLKTNTSKTKFFARAREAFNETRGPSFLLLQPLRCLDSRDGWQGSQCGYLPLALSTKALFASTLCAPKAAWGTLLGGLPLKQGVRKQFKDGFRFAVIGRKPQGNRRALNLREF